MFFLKLMLRPLKLLPPAAAVWVMRLARVPFPHRLARRIAVERDSIAGVDTVWINKQAIENGVIIHFHGGGFVSGPAGLQWAWLARLSEESGKAALMIDYSKSFMAPFPAALNEACAVITHLDQAGILRKGNWAMTADSAGGGLGTAVCRHILDKNVIPPACLVLLSPCVDMRTTNPDMHALQKVDVQLSIPLLNYCNSEYAPGEDLSRPELSPIEGRVDDFPPVLIFVGTEDMLMPNIRLFASKLEDAGVVIDYVEQPGGIHDYGLILSVAPGRAAFYRTVGWINAHIGRASPETGPLVG